MADMFLTNICFLVSPVSTGTPAAPMECLLLMISWPFARFFTERINGSFRLTIVSNRKQLRQKIFPSFPDDFSFDDFFA